MNCRETQNLLHAYGDGELDLVRSLDVEQHLRECEGCSQERRSLDALSAAIKNDAPRFDAPPRLRKRLRAALREADRADRVPRRLPWRLAPAFAGAALMGLLVWVAAPRFGPSAAGSLVAQEVLASHLRSLQVAGHFADVISTDQHTVKPWFNGKLDFSPPVRDPAAAGFPLAGGRLDYLNNRPVAALVYYRHKHPINLFIWPSGAGEAPAPARISERGYHLLHWSQGGMTFWAVSDLNEAELEQFEALIRH